MLSHRHAETEESGQYYQNLSQVYKVVVHSILRVIVILYPFLTEAKKDFFLSIRPAINVELDILNHCKCRSV